MSSVIIFETSQLRTKCDVFATHRAHFGAQCVVYTTLNVNDVEWEKLHNSKS